MLYLDLDRFKTVNDNLGHERRRPRCSHVVGSRLRRHVRPSDSVARLGGDEFAAVLPDLATTRARRCRSRERLLAAIAEPVDARRRSTSSPP